MITEEKRTYLRRNNVELPKEDCEQHLKFRLDDCHTGEAAKALPWRYGELDPGLPPEGYICRMGIRQGSYP